MKTEIRRLDSVTHNDTTATKLINDNFSALQQGIEDSLSRSGKTPNYMDADLDLNTRRIINSGYPVNPNDAATKKYVDDIVEGIDELERALNQEIIDRGEADTALQGNIDAEEARAKAAEKAITDTLDTYGNIVTHDVDEFATAAQGALADTAVQPEDIGNATLTIKKNSASVGTFTADAKEDVDINIVVPTQASDVNALPDSTKYGASISLTINSGTYVVTAQLKDQDGNNLGSAQTIDLPLESVVVGGEYDSATQSIILTLDNGNTITIPVGALVNGLQEEITASNKLDADLVDDSTSTNKFVTTGEKSTWSGKQDALVSGTSIKTINNESLLGSGNITLLTASDIANMQTTANLVTSVTSASTDTQYPSAKLFYDTCGDVESLINAL